MNTNNQNSLQSQYDALKPYANGHLAPRKGFYKILTTTTLEITGHHVFVADGLWHPNGEGLDNGLHVRIQLYTLTQDLSTGPKHEVRNGLAGKTIIVKESKLVSGGSNAKFYSVEWDIFNNVIQPRNLLFRTLTTNLGDLLASVNQSLGENALEVSDTMEQEGTSSVYQPLISWTRFAK